jgi:uncharacterized protein YijF (DUF1287 family)
MSHNPYGSLNTIEYIGPRPQKPKKNFFGGWVILVISVAMALVFGRPLLASLKSEQVVGTQAAADQMIEELGENPSANHKLAIAALTLTKSGDPSSAASNTADLLLKVYQSGLSINVKDLLHEDMSNAFSQYPQLWYERGPNKEIDASRVQNIQRFFHRSGDDFRNADPIVGDVIFWTLPDGNAHAAIIVPGPGLHSNEMWIVHHWQGSVVWENKLSDFIMPLGRYRFGQ